MRSKSPYFYSQIKGTWKMKVKFQRKKYYKKICYPKNKYKSEAFSIQNHLYYLEICAFHKSDFHHLKRFLNDRKLLCFSKKIRSNYDKLNNSDGSIQYNNSLQETPPKKKSQVPLICLSLKKEKAHQLNQFISCKDSPNDHKDAKEKHNNNIKTLVKCPIITVDLCLEGKQFQIDIFAKETAFDVVKRIMNEKKTEFFLENVEENIKRKKIKILAEILQRKINGFIEELSDYVEKERKEKFKIFKPKINGKH